MKSNLLIIVTVLCVAVLFAGTVAAQDAGLTKDTFGDSDVVFTEPDGLEAGASQDFSIEVTNGATENDNYIYKVDLTMASEDYIVNENNLDAPNPLHANEISKWEVTYDVDDNTISWMAFSGTSSSQSGALGDIRAGESLSFQFTAMVDEVGTDGFDWVIYGDASNVVFGTAYVGQADDDDNEDDDDDEEDDDDDNPFFDNDDDDARASDDGDDSGSCGC